MDVFSWTYIETSSLAPEIFMHSLFVGPNKQSRKQDLTQMHPVLASKVEGAVEKLIKAYFIKEGQYLHSWANRTSQKEKWTGPDKCILLGSK